MSAEPREPGPVNYSPDNSYPLLGILWHRNPEEATADIRYTNIVPGGAENGGYIYYGIRDNLPLDAFYDIYNKSQDNLITIQWSLEACQRPRERPHPLR